jgi:DNA helicase-2/ATP-dependent DNA helicase PcrA
MFIADLHIHSFLSRATAKNLNLEHLILWAQLKGIRVLGTGDFTHPQWFSELQEKLEEVEPGLFCLRSEVSAVTSDLVPQSCRAPVRFMLSAEISCIYKKNGLTRKSHNVVFVPDFESAKKLNRALERIGNLRSDGRPILGLDAHDLLETVLDVNPHAHLIPAHIWTPWFSLFGSKSGFDALEECFEDLSHHIFAVETGLSSDPPMNWRLSALDDLALVSNSDAHSPSNIGREANIFDTDLSYLSLFEALRAKDLKRFLGTIEFFPEEGKYHYDGHRKCDVRMSPRETRETKGLCPKCGRPVTVGVMHRVEELADREAGVKPPGAAAFKNLLTLPDILAQTRGVGTKTRWVQTQYRRLLEEHGPEFTILMDLPPETLEVRGHRALAEGLRRMRQGKVHIRAGYDGEFGSIVLFSPEERQNLAGQGSLIAFGPDSGDREMPRPEKARRTSKSGAHGEALLRDDSAPAQTSSVLPDVSRNDIDSLLKGLNVEQKRAVCHGNTPLLIVAGPGTGKTLTLTRRIAYLVRRGIAQPEHVLAVTFTKKAAQEMHERLGLLLGEKNRVQVQTFHGLGYEILREQRAQQGEAGKVIVLDEMEAEDLFKEVLSRSDCPVGRKERVALREKISAAKQKLQMPEAFETVDPDFALLYHRYQEALGRAGASDFDDLVSLPVRLLETEPARLVHYRKRFPFVSVDEYQDVNQAQYRLVRLLSPHGDNLCVIGDPDQAIYGFRGADNRYFLEFEKDYPGGEVIRLTQNFRSAETILQASARLLNQNSNHLDASLWSGIQGEDFLSMGTYPTDRAEAESIVHTIEQLVGGTSYFSLDSGRVDAGQSRETRSFSDFAVFYRLHFQGEILEEALARSGIPYRRIGGRPLTKHGPVRKILQILRKGLEMGSLQSEAHRLVSRSAAGEGESGLGEIVRNVINDLGLDPTEEILKTFVQQADTWQGHMSDFLAEIAFKSDLDLYDPRAEKVTLMTLHASKGLEFSVVFIAGCEEDILPCRLAEDSAPSMEEERRLFYVGLTRAKEKIFLTRALRRPVFGRILEQRPSPFLGEIEDHLKQAAVSLRRGSVKKDDGQLRLF